MAVHLKGHFCISSHAVHYWRGQSKEGKPVDARIINTTSGAGLQGSIGQSNYAAAKAGIAALTLNQAAELGRYNITANAVAPSARTGMTSAVPEMAERMAKPEDGSFDHLPRERIQSAGLAGSRRSGGMSVVGSLRQKVVAFASATAGAPPTVLIAAHRGRPLTSARR